MKNFDYYNEAKELSFLLEKEGKSEYANVLIDAIEQGSVGTEIFMALKYHLGFIIKLKDISHTSRKIAICLFNEIDKVLQQ